MEPSNYDVYFARGTGQMAAHNRSENGRGASAALYAHPTHTHTSFFPFRISLYSVTVFVIIN